MGVDRLHRDGCRQFCGDGARAWHAAALDHIRAATAAGPVAGHGTLSLRAALLQPRANELTEPSQRVVHLAIEWPRATEPNKRIESACIRKNRARRNANSFCE